TEKNDADSILARLKRDDPETAQKVINGELTATARSTRPHSYRVTCPGAHLDRTTNTEPSSTTSRPIPSNDRTARRHCRTGIPTRSANSETDQSRRSRFTASNSFRCVLPIPRDIKHLPRGGHLETPHP